MNIGIFTIILSLKVKDRYVEFIKDLSGISNKKPIISACISIIMFSMAGIPPFAGFFAKFYIFIAALKSDLLYLAILGVISSVISAYYYLRIIKVMYFDESDLKFNSYFTKNAGLILFLSIFAISFFILYPSLLINIAIQVSSASF